ncbi:2-dehydro-3-deoxy-D-gluconate 5-dehydrogenase [Novipirellula aureliae]|uniref:2-dehydro-3-deoxy-D-gluconate 5-dehydrogenase n=1 Tax=Novipirellula aureliae TaxID=2527966 RepID=A0A5C6EED1_9BACT|nr:SDR family oxidoreductase [Novipirellula aureliae]TWU45579.1 2-dehydro-3-deoxy-D-gluconate 5-dehydrogenase [Novipirellula aureliae]
MILDSFNLAGKTALVTGASTGIGQGMATALAEAGADIINLCRTEKEGERGFTKDIIAKLGRNYFFYSTDFSDRESLYAGIKVVKEKFGTIDILVNNAGTIMRKPIAEHPDEYWDRVIEINLNSQFILTREFGKDMVERGNGKIVFTCSLLTFQGGITVPGYAASKAGVGRLVMSFANEWASKGVNVNGIAPGYIATANTQPLRDDPVRSKAILERIPANRWGTPEDFGGPCVFLASEASSYMNGSIVTVDGGWMGR